MANTDWAFGFAPWQNVISANIYAVVTTPVVHIYHQDMVGVEAIYVSTPAHGYLQAIQDAIIINDLDNLLGSVMAIFDENMVIELTAITLVRISWKANFIRPRREQTTNLKSQSFKPLAFGSWRPKLGEI